MHEDMCKEVGAYPKCAACPSFVPPDPTPGVMTWDELLTHMDNLADWGQDQLKAWGKQARFMTVKLCQAVLIEKQKKVATNYKRYTKI